MQINFNRIVYCLDWMRVICGMVIVECDIVIRVEYTEYAGKKVSNARVHSIWNDDLK